MLIRRFNEHSIWKRRVRVFGHRFRAPSLDRFASLWLHKLGILGKDEVKILVGLVSKGMTVVDVGANQGIYTLLLAQLVGPGRVIAFEPEPLLYQQLLSNLQDNCVKNVTCRQLAISDHTGLLVLRPGAFNRGDNRIVADQEKDQSGITVTAASLDEVLPNEKIDVLKMDIQGWEPQALAGANETLEQNPDLILMFEYWPYGVSKAGSSPGAILSFLEKRGFKLWQPQNGKLISLERIKLPDSKREFAYCNLVATKNVPLVGSLIG